MAKGTLRVRIVGDASNFRKSLDKAQGKVGGFAKQLGKMGVLAAGAGAAVAAGFGLKAVKAASELNETLSKTQQVFGKAAGDVTGFADKMGKAFGLPKQEILDAASNIGLVAKASGLSEAAAAGMSTEMAQLAADAASFYNVPLPVALEKIRSGLVGEAEPLRQFGVLLSAAAVEEKAVALGIAQVGEELTEQQKVMARSAIITEQMSDASGDLERTQGSMANQVRMLKGRFENFTAEIGQRLLPLANEFLGWLADHAPAAMDAVAQFVDTKLLPAFAAISDWWKVFGPAITDAVQSFARGFGNAVGWIGDRIQSVGRFFGVTRQTVADEVTQMSDEAVGAVVEMVSGMTDQARMMALNGQTLSAEMADQWIANVHKMRDDSIAAINEQHAESVATANELHADLGSISAQQRDDIVAEADGQRDDSVKAATEQAEKVTAEIERQKNAGVAITREQAAQIVEAMEGQRDDVITALTDQRHQSEAILAKLRAESGRLTLETAAEAIANSAKQMRTTIANAEEEYDGRVAAILELQRDSDTFTQAMADDAIAEARRQRDDTIGAAEEQHFGVVAQIKQMREGVMEEVDVMTGAVISDFDRFRDRLVRWHAEGALVFAAMVGEMRNFKARMQEWVDDTSMKVGAAIGYFASIPGRVLDALSTLGQHMFNVGAEALRMLGEGIKSFDLWGAIRGIFSGLLDKVKGFFGIGSPSKVFHQLGRDIAQGMAQGIKADADQVNRAARHLADAAGVDFHRDVGRGGGLAPTQGLNPEFLRRFHEYNAQLGGILRIVSGFRSTKQQARLYQLYLAGRGNKAAPPGRSMHEKGLAIDHAPRSNPRMRGIARQHRLHYPVGGEPWHVEPFDSGGWLPPHSTTLAVNNTAMWEPVGVGTHMKMPQPPVSLNVRVFIGDRELTDIVDVQIDERDRAGARDLRQTARSRQVIG